MTIYTKIIYNNNRYITFFNATVAGLTLRLSDAVDTRDA